MSIRLIINPLASYLCNCVAELQRSVLGVGINRYVENLKKCNDRQVLGLSEKNNKNTHSAVRQACVEKYQFFV